MPCQGFSDDLLAQEGLRATADGRNAYHYHGGARVSMPAYMLRRGHEPDLVGGGGGGQLVASGDGGAGSFSLLSLGATFRFLSSTLSSVASLV